MAKSSRALKRKRARQASNGFSKRKNPPHAKTLGKHIIEGLWTSVQILSNAITLYQALDEGTKTAIKGALKQVTMSFVVKLQGQRADEQVVAAARMIEVQRKVIIWFGQIELPAKNGEFGDSMIATGLEQLLLDAIDTADDVLNEHLDNWLAYWRLCSKLPPKDRPARPRKI